MSSRKNIDLLLERLLKLTRQVSRGKYGNPEEIFELTKTGSYPQDIADLAESFGMMIVKVEAREFQLQEAIEKLKEANRRLNTDSKKLARENAQLKDSLRQTFSPDALVGTTPVMQALRKKVERLADTSLSILITGETGTGKELVAEAIHSFGHRVESSIVHAYGDRWDVYNEDPTGWEIFTRVEKDLPGKAHIGNIHFPPNGVSDYDYSNRTYVRTYADNWKRYPVLLDQSRMINCIEWGSSQLGYMRWWHNHLPRFTGVTDGVLNNWWHYVVDYEGAVARAANLSQIEENENGYSQLKPGAYILEQNYPNPFNPFTKIRFSIQSPQQVSLKVYDILGREVKVLVNDRKAAGDYEVNFDGSALVSGMYLYKLTAGDHTKVKKLLLLK